MTESMIRYSQLIKIKMRRRDVTMIRRIKVKKLNCTSCGVDITGRGYFFRGTTMSRLCNDCYIKEFNKERENEKIEGSYWDKEKGAYVDMEKSSITFCEMHKSSGCGECPNRYVCDKEDNTMKKSETLRCDICDNGIGDQVFWNEEEGVVCIACKHHKLNDLQKEQSPKYVENPQIMFNSLNKSIIEIRDQQIRDSKKMGQLQYFLEHNQGKVKEICKQLNIVSDIMDTIREYVVDNMEDPHIDDDDINNYKQFTSKVIEYLHDFMNTDVEETEIDDRYTQKEVDESFSRVIDILEHWLKSSR